VKRPMRWGNVISDCILLTVTSLGLFFSFLLPAILITPFIRYKVFRFKWESGYTLLILSTTWALVVILFRGVGDASGLLLQYAFLWVVPFITLLYRPSYETLQLLKGLIVCLFVLDLIFNLYVAVTGNDLLGRIIDLRPGLIGSRGGGLFGHSFYSGTISLLAYVFAIASPRFRLFAIFGALNLLLAGSWRLAIPLVLVPYFFWRWEKRSRISELVQIVVISALVVVLIVVTSDSSVLDLDGNAANALRIFAWNNAFSEINSSPIFGVGYPKTTGLESIDIDTIKDSLIAESWYLNASITFGVPYMIARLLGLLLIFYGHRFKSRSLAEALFVPIILIDLTYGGFFESALFYIIFWFVLVQDRDNLPERRWLKSGIYMKA